MGLLSGIVKAIYKPLDIAVTTFAHPIQVASAIVSPNKTVAQVVAKTIAEPKAKQITDVLVAGASYAGIAGGIKTVATKGITKVAAAVMPKSNVGKVAAAATAIVATPIVITNPSVVTKAANVVASTPSKLSAFGSDVGQLTKDPSVKGFVEVVKENPEVSAGLTIAAGALGAKFLLPTAANLVSNTFGDDVKAITPTSTPNIIPSSSVLPTETKSKVIAQEPPAVSNLAPSSQLPPTPQTQVITSSTTSVRRKKYSKKLTIPPISQKVNVIIGNKTFINRRVYA